MILRSSKSIGPPPTAVARSMTISRKGGGSTPADSKKAMKPMDSVPKSSCSASLYRRMLCVVCVPMGT